MDKAAANKEVDAKITEYLLKVVAQGKLNCGLEVQGNATGGLITYPADRLLEDGGFEVTRTLRKRLNSARNSKEVLARILKDHRVKKSAKTPEERQEEKLKRKAEKQQRKKAKREAKQQAQVQAEELAGQEGGQMSYHYYNGQPRPQPWLQPQFNHPQFNNQGPGFRFPHPNMEMGGPQWRNFGPQQQQQQWQNWQVPNQQHHYYQQQQQQQQRNFRQQQQQQQQQNRRFQQPHKRFRPQPAPEVAEENQRQKRRLEEQIQEAKENVEKKLKLKEKASWLKKKLEESRGKETPAEDKETPVEEQEQATSKEVNQSAERDSSSGTRHFNSDLQLNPEELKKVGTNQAMDLSDQDKQQHQEQQDDLVDARLEEYGNLVERDMSAEHDGKRISIATGGGGCKRPVPAAEQAAAAENAAAAPKKRKRRRIIDLQSSSSSDDDDDGNNDVEKKKKRKNPRDSETYRRLMANMKKAIMAKDRDYLDELVNCPPKMKRVQLGTLMEEHRAGVLRELTRLRFSNKTNTSTSGDGRDDNDSVLAEIRKMEAQCKDFEEVSVDQIPDSFLQQIEDFIKGGTGSSEMAKNDGHQTTENENVYYKDDDDDIVEVPVPPKPPAPLVDLESEDEAVAALAAAFAAPPDQDCTNPDTNPKGAASPQVPERSKSASEKSDSEPEHASAKDLSSDEDSDSDSSSTTTSGSSNPEQQQSNAKDGSGQQRLQLGGEQLEWLMQISAEEQGLRKQMEEIMDRLNYLGQLRAEILQQRPDSSQN